MINSKKYVISLERRPDRRVQFEKTAKAAGIENYTFFSAIDAESLTYNNELIKYTDSPIKKRMGQVACRISHLEVIKLCKAENLPYAFIMEDDADVDPFISHKLPEVLKGLPENWDMLYLGAHNFRGLQLITENIGKCVTTLSTVCYIVPKKNYDLFIKYLAMDEILDIIYCNYLHPKINAYCVTPNLVMQRAGFSDIEGQELDYTKYYKKGQ